MNKLKSLHIKNFQNHKDSVLNYHPGVNIISGSSRAGKSAILRSLRLQFENRPGGIEFIPHNSEKGTTTFVKTEFDDFLIERERSETKNEYKLIRNGKTETYKKFGQSVPDEISNALNLKPYNFQSQHSPYFLLQNSGSEVAEELNKIAGLQIIDQCLDNANTDINSINSEKKTSKKTIKDLVVKRNNLKILNDIQPFFDELDGLILQKEKVEYHLSSISELISRCSIYQIKIDEIEEFLKITDDLNTLKETIKTFNSLTLQITTLDRILNQIKSIEEKIKECNKTLKVKEDAEDLIKIIDEYQKISYDHKKLNTALTKFINLQNAYDELVEWLKVKKDAKEIIDLMQQFEDVKNAQRDIDIYISQQQNMILRINNLDKLVEIKTEQRKKMIKDMGICVLCGSKVK